MDGGAGAGVNISPVGFLLVENKTSPFPRFIPVNEPCAVDKLLDYIPDLLKKIEDMMCDKNSDNTSSNNEKTSTENETQDNKNKPQEKNFDEVITIETDEDDL